jgi:hypothetical protein
MCLNCSFPHREPLNKEFPIAVDSAGAIGLANESVSGLSQYLLAPVLFDKYALRTCSAVARVIRPEGR